MLTEKKFFLRFISARICFSSLDNSDLETVLVKFWLIVGQEQGCQMVFFKPKIQIWVNLGGPKNMLVYVMPIWNILLAFGIFYAIW
jgi:hypothetical protein